MGVFFMFSIITVLICPAFILHRAFPRVFKHEIRAQSEPYSHREYNLAMRIQVSLARLGAGFGSA